MIEIGTNDFNDFLEFIESFYQGYVESCKGEAKAIKDEAEKNG